MYPYAIKIKSVKFQNSNNRFGNKEAIATMENGDADVFVIAWFDDELTFFEEELIGLTVREANDLKQVRDIAYLRS